MSLKTCHLLPHSPLLIPEIGKNNYDLLTKTKESYEDVFKQIKENNVETLIIISQHAGTSNDSFFINVAPEMNVNLKDFGFIPAKTNFNGDAVLADKINANLKDSFKVKIISNSILDYGSAIPLYILKGLGYTGKILIISPATELDHETHRSFGNKLNEIIKSSDKNISIIVSGDLSHRLKKNSPAGYSIKGAKFDNKLIEYLNDARTALDNIIKMEPILIKNASECAYNSLLILLGLLENRDCETEILSYQTDFGIGYLSAHFNLK